MATPRHLPMRLLLVQKMIRRNKEIINQILPRLNRRLQTTTTTTTAAAAAATTTAAATARTRSDNLPILPWRQYQQHRQSTAAIVIAIAKLLRRLHHIQLQHQHLQSQQQQQQQQQHQHLRRTQPWHDRVPFQSAPSFWSPFCAWPAKLSFITAKRNPCGNSTSLPM